MGERIRCPFCGAGNFAHDAQCLTCGRNLPTPGRRSGAEAATAQPPVRRPSVFARLVSALLASRRFRRGGGRCDVCGGPLDRDARPYSDDTFKAALREGFCPMPPEKDPDRWLLAMVERNWSDVMGERLIEEAEPWQQKMLMTDSTPWNLCSSCAGEFRVFMGEEQWGSELLKTIVIVPALLGGLVASLAAMTLGTGFLGIVLRISLPACVLPSLWWLVDQLRKSIRRLRQTRPSTTSAAVAKDMLLDLLTRVSRAVAFVALLAVLLGWLVGTMRDTRFDQVHWAPVIVRTVSLLACLPALVWWVSAQLTEAVRDRGSQRDRAALLRIRGNRL